MSRKGRLIRVASFAASLVVLLFVLGIFGALGSVELLLAFVVAIPLGLAVGGAVERRLHRGRAAG